MPVAQKVDVPVAVPVVQKKQDIFVPIFVATTPAPVVIISKKGGDVGLCCDWERSWRALGAIAALHSSQASVLLCAQRHQNVVPLCLGSSTSAQPRKACVLPALYNGLWCCEDGELLAALPLPWSILFGDLSRTR